MDDPSKPRQLLAQDAPLNPADVQLLPIAAMSLTGTMTIWSRCRTGMRSRIVGRVAAAYSSAAAATRLADSSCGSVRYPLPNVGTTLFEKGDILSRTTGGAETPDGSLVNRLNDIANTLVRTPGSFISLQPANGLTLATSKSPNFPL